MSDAVERESFRGWGRKGGHAAAKRMTKAERVARVKKGAKASAKVRKANAKAKKAAKAGE